MTALGQSGQAFLKWWHDARGSGKMPPKHAFNPRNMKDLADWLPLMVLLEFTPDERLMIRYLGFGFTNTPGDLTGTNAFDIYPDNMKDRYRQFYNEVYTRPVGGVLWRQLIGRNNTPVMQHTTFLPMTDTASAHGYIIGLREQSAAEVRLKAGTDSTTDFSHVYREEYLDIGSGVPTSGVFDPPAV